MLRRRAGQISGGGQQMLAIARTLMTAPKLLLLAEQNNILAERADRVITLVAGELKP